MKLLGLRLCEHDSNISYFDGSEVYYYKSERNYGIKHHGIDDLWSWREEIKRLWNVNYDDIDEIAIVIDPWRHKLPFIGPNGPCKFPSYEKIFPAIEYDYLPSKSKVYRVDHHYAHALSCWPVEIIKSKVQFVIDGYGDYPNSWTVFVDNKICERGYLKQNGSLGMSYGKAGIGLGLKSNNPYDFAGKVMAYQAYGKINDIFKEKIKKFDMYNINELFDYNLQSNPKQQTTEIHNDVNWIRTIHEHVGEILLNFFEKFTNKNYDMVISYSGGVAQNVMWNTVLKNKFKNLVIPPHCNDEGLSLGSIEYLRIKNKLPQFKFENFPYRQSDQAPETTPDSNTIKQVVNLLKEGKIIGWYQGNGEIGPRALGHRSLLINPLIRDARNIINKIKKREKYRPFGASILKEHVREYFNTDFENEHMLYVGKTDKENLESVTHIDKTCRFQSVSEKNGCYYELIKTFYEETGCPLLLNTSFNVNGKPILDNIDNTIEFFKDSNIDYLVIGNKILMNGPEVESYYDN